MFADPSKLAAIRTALEYAGVIFVDENGEGSGARLRRFRVGDVVRLRPQTRVRFSFDIKIDEVGTVVDVEPHPPRTAGTSAPCRTSRRPPSAMQSRSAFFYADLSERTTVAIERLLGDRE